MSGAMRPGPPPILRQQPVALQMAAQVYAHCWIMVRGADRVPGLRERVDGGFPAPPGRARDAGAARLLAALDAAIGEGTVPLGRRGRRGACVVIGERALVQAVAVGHHDLAACCTALGLAATGRRRAVLSAALVRALTRMRAVDGIDAVFA